MKSKIVAVIVLFCLPAVAMQHPCITFSSMPAATAVYTLPPTSQQGAFALLDADHALVRGPQSLEVVAFAGGAPSQVALLTGLPHDAWRCPPAIVGHHAFLAGDPAIVVDLADPVQPQVVLTLSEGYQGLAASGALLAASTLGAGTVLLDVTTPLAPIPVGSVAQRGRVDLAGSVLAVMADGVWLYDVSDPVLPVLITSVEYPTESGGSGPDQYVRSTDVLAADLQGDRLVLVTGTYEQTGGEDHGNLQITNLIARRVIDISDPLQPQEIAHRPVRASAELPPALDFNLVRHGALLIDGRDVFDPADVDLAPLSVLPAFQPIPGGVLMLTGERVAVCDRHQISIVPAAALLIDNTVELAAPTGAGAVDHVDLVGAHTFRVRLDATIDDDQSTATLALFVGSLQQPVYQLTYFGDGATVPRFMAGSGDAIVAGNHFYRTNGDFPTELIEHPLDLPPSVSALAFKSPRLLAATVGEVELRLFDVSDPGNILPIGTTALPAGTGAVHALAWTGACVLVGSEQGLTLVRADNPLAPEIAATMPLGAVHWIEPLPGSTPQVLVHAGSRLARIDITDPGTPAILVDATAGILGGRPWVIDFASLPFAYSSLDGLLSLYNLQTLEPVGTVATGVTLDRIVFSGGLLGAGKAFPGLTGLSQDCDAMVIPVAAPPSVPRLALTVEPNPFNPLTTARFNLDRAATIRLTVHDARGRLIRELAGGRRGVGAHEVTWDGRHDDGRQAAAGVYMLNLEAGAAKAVVKMVLLK